MDISSPHSNRDLVLAGPVIDVSRRVELAQAQVNLGIRDSDGSMPARFISTRLATRDETQLVAEYRAGLTRRELAERYGISDSSVKRLLRRHGANRHTGV